MRFFFHLTTLQGFSGFSSAVSFMVHSCCKEPWQLNINDDIDISNVKIMCLTIIFEMCCLFSVLHNDNTYLHNCHLSDINIWENRFFPYRSSIWATQWVLTEHFDEKQKSGNLRNIFFYFIICSLFLYPKFHGPVLEKTLKSYPFPIWINASYS